ncbi:DUF2793 domain-containing protein [Litorimonas sp. RW-G-Af-16]|uniref:DUF2793 domain-containing protein n=1 Tax=Litorimonas sp. RW-G-Af-16 TaxID=3241168 RepID=UPI00390CCA6A
MDLKTPHLDLPMIAPAQAQKHVTHNEAIFKLDAITQLSLRSRTAEVDVDSMSDGDRQIVPANSPIGEAGDIAQKDGAAMIYHRPKLGWVGWVEDEDLLVVWTGADGWTPVSSQSSLTSLTQLGVNAASDPTNRLSVASEATLLSHDGDDHRLKINKNIASDTASLLFQSGFNGHAEFGLTGTNDLTVRVSADGTDFMDSLVIDQTSGAVSHPKQPVIYGTLGQQVESPARQTFAPQGGMINAMTNMAKTSLIIPDDGVYMFSASQLVQVISAVHYWFLVINGVTVYIAQNNGNSFAGQQHANHIVYTQSFQAGDQIELTSNNLPSNSWIDTFSHFSLVKIA